MPFFGRKKKEEPQEMPADIPPVSMFDQPPAEPEQTIQYNEPPPPVIRREPEKPAVAPLFVKMDRYRQILTTIGNLKTALMIVKNSLGTLQQIERVRDETFGIITDLVEKMDDKLISLDNDLLRPAGFHETEESSPEKQDIRSIEATVSDLQGQIEQLKLELGKMMV